MKTAISIPDDVFRKVEQATKRLGISRSELFTRAVREFLEVRERGRVKASYDEAFDDAPAKDELESLHRAAARRALENVTVVTCDAARSGGPT